MPDKILPVKVIPSSRIEKDIKKLRKKYDSVDRDIEPLIKELEAGETPGNKISGNKYPVYKVRVKNSNNRRGKSAGYRVIYYTVTPEAILLTTIYSKSERENISNEEIEDIIAQYEQELDRQQKEIMNADSENFEIRE
jgi:mRNA-degrading endonuclease RelE of RelBE toxin-antitoxin system